MPRLVKLILKSFIAVLSFASLSHADEITDMLVSEFDTICLSSDLNEDRYRQLSQSAGWESMPAEAFNDPNVATGNQKMFHAAPALSSFGYLPMDGGDKSPFCSVMYMGANSGQLVQWVMENFNVSEPQENFGLVTETIFDVEIETAPSVTIISVKSGFGLASIIAGL